MGNDVLTTEEKNFIQANADEIRAFANQTFAGHVPMDKRGKYELIALKLGKRSVTCWTCGGSIKRIGKMLEQCL